MTPERPAREVRDYYTLARLDLDCVNDAVEAMGDDELEDLHRAVVDGVERMCRRLDEKLGRDEPGPRPDGQMDLTDALED